MVQVRKSYPQLADGSLDVDSWLQQLSGFASDSDRQRMQLACDLANTAQSNSKLDKNSGRIGCFEYGLEMATILNELRLDEDSLIAAVAYRSVREQHVNIKTVRQALGGMVAQLIEGVLQMAIISERHTGAQSVLGQGQTQVDNLRKMLVAMFDDVRVGLIKLAERTQAIRDVKKQSRERQVRVAHEVFDVYVPLAHRLGIGHIKWELEDLSFRYLEPEVYKNIALLLDEKRLARQEYIDNVKQIIETRLQEENIQAEVSGRAKHIYSIWKKMQRKNVSFDQVYDIRAIRIMVNELKDCYSSLGVVHTLWRNIPREFDDYIANPKRNGYRSLHTAVIGPESKILEVQIRTHDMHDEAELGLCAHWIYKGTDNESQSRSYEQKIEWFRQALNNHDTEAESNDIGELAEEFSDTFDKDRIYVFTPQGHVVDIAFGSTPIDFAYHIHTEVGHKCRGAKVDGRIVPLNTVLQNGQQVQILTGKEAAPNRDWLRTGLGYLNSTSARSKVRSWFKKQAREENINVGRALLDRELKRLALTSIDYKILAEHLGFSIVEDLYAAMGSGDMPTGQVLRAAEKLFSAGEVAQVALFAPGRQLPSNDIVVSGVGNLVTVSARCCKPLPGDEIVGYVTLNRGVSIHRKDCTEFLQASNQQPERVIEVAWGREETGRHPVDIVIEAYDRTGLLGDITGLLSAMRVNVINATTRTNRADNTAHTRLTVEISDIEQLVRLLGRLNSMPNIISALRASH